MSQPSPSLTLKDLHFHVPSMERPILDKLNVTVNTGDFVIVLGSNGSGKSSLLTCINGSSKPTSGQVLLDKQDLCTLKPEQIAAHVSSLGQSISASSYGCLSVAENCALAGKASEEEILQVLEQCNPELKQRLNTPASQLSGGQRQCLALALCLLRRPKLLLLDEHTSALDPKTARSVMKLTAEIHLNRPSIMVMMSTHSLEDALTYGNRLLVMHRGRCVLDISKEEKQHLEKEDLLKFYE